MQEPERPPLHPLAYEQIDQMLHRADLSHWTAIAEMRGSRYYPPDQLVPPRTPQHLLSHIRFYATTLFKTEADQYEQFRPDKRYQRWLSLLSDRVIARVKDALEKLESRDPMSLILGYHGLNWLEVETDLKAMLAAIVMQYDQGTAPSQVRGKPAAHPLAATNQTQGDTREPQSRKSGRLSSTITSQSAASKVDAYIKRSDKTQTQFAIRAGTTDKTIRKFRQTGTIRRSLLPGIATAMGTTTEELLK